VVEDLIRRARRRLVLNETLAQSALAASVAIGGVALLLILGTRYLEGWTIALFAAAGAAIGIARIHRKTPDSYTTAIRLDLTGGLQDALSTAFHFAHSSKSGPEEFRRAQRLQAEQAALGIRLDEAVPFTFPRALYAMAALSLLASGLVAVRWRTGHGLDLRAPITELLFEDQALPLAKNDARKMPRGNGDALEKAIDQALKGPGEADAKKNMEPARNGGDNKTAADQAPGDPIANDDQSNNIDQVDLDGQNAKEGDEGEKSSKDLKPSERESLYSKLKDAVSNLLSKNRQQGDKSGQQGQKQQQQQAQKNDSKNRDKGDSAKDQQQQQGDNDQSDGQEAQAEADAERAQKEQAKLNSSSDQQKAQEGDGIGKQDGKKEIREAEQLKAMGKISEIIGQRSATVSGETSIEMQSGNQQLTTAYSNTSASHRETDGDVSRDEIPLALQSYVQQYFQEVRKSSAGQKKKASK
jgi:hypothetical protein